MSTRQRTGVILLLVGVGIPLVLYPFADFAAITFWGSVRRMYIRLWETKAEECVAPRQDLPASFKQAFVEVIVDDYFKAGKRWTKRDGYRVCTLAEYAELPYRYVFALGVVLVLSGLGALILPKVGDKKGETT